MKAFFFSFVWGVPLGCFTQHCASRAQPAFSAEGFLVRSGIDWMHG
jgi:hypothetical protein